MLDRIFRNLHGIERTSMMMPSNVLEEFDRRRGRRATSCRGGHKNRKRSIEKRPQPTVTVVFHILLLLSLFSADHQTSAAMATTTKPTTIKRVDLVKPGGFVAGENLVTSNVPVPSPNTNNEVLIDVKASAVNPVDWKQATYNFMVPVEVSTNNPVALGCDVAGIVVGPESSPLWGKNVVTYLGADKSGTGATRGGFTEQVLADEDLVFELPADSDITLSEAATLPVGGLTAGLLLEGIEPAKQRKEAHGSNWIVIWGTSSSVGWFALQLAKQDGYKVIAIASSKHKDSAMALGADAFIDYRQEDDIVGAVTKIVQDDDGTSAMNAAIDCIGTDDTFNKCCEIINKLASSSDSATTKLVSCTNFGPDGPDGVKRVAVNLGTANETNRDFVKTYFPKRLFGLKPQPIKLVEKSPVDANVVEHAFQLNQNGVSGEKIAIEWD